MAFTSSKASPKDKPKTFDAWSYSRFAMWRECPYRAKLKHIDKLEEPGSAAMDKGNAVHKDCERFVKGELKTLPLYLKGWAAEFKTLREKRAEAEAEWAFDNQWAPTGWFQKGEHAAWCRVKVDATYVDGDTLVIVDYKTGRYYPKNEEQMRLYVLAGMLRRAYDRDERIARVRNELWYLDSEELLPLEIPFSKPNLESFRKEWATAVKPMMADTRFAPTPSSACSRCHYRKSNGGPCKY